MSTRHYVELIAYKAYAELRQEAGRTYLGFLWWIVEPVISLMIYALVFGTLLKRGGEGFVAFLFVGLAMWRWFNSTVMAGANSLPGNRGLMQQVYVPKLVFPTVSILTSSAKFGFLLLALLAYLWVTGHTIGASYLALPVLLATELLLITFLTYCVAAVVPFVPDLRLALDHAFRLLFFLSGIFFSIASVPAPYQSYLRLNPIASLIEAFRSVLIDGAWPSWGPVLVIAVFSALGIALGSALIGRYDRVYPKLA
jgi:lipopolysaccharide transport system permease protein